MNFINAIKLDRERIEDRFYQRVLFVIAYTCKHTEFINQSFN